MENCVDVFVLEIQWFKHRAGLLGELACHCVNDKKIDVDSQELDSGRPRGRPQIPLKDQFF